MKKFLCALLLAALLCGLFAQAAGAEIAAIDTTRNFADSFAAGWREAILAGEDIGVVLEVRLTDLQYPYCLSDIDDPVQEATDPEVLTPRVVTFSVRTCLYGEFEGEELTLVCSGERALALSRDIWYVARVKNQPPQLADRRGDGTLPEELAGDWTLCEIFPVLGSTVYVPVGYSSDLGLYLEDGVTETIVELEEPHVPTALITGNRVNVRAGAGASFRSLGKVNEGDVVVLLGTEGRWVHILYDGMKGYVWDAYVSYS